MKTLTFVMRLNAASCLTFGLLFVLASNAIAAFLGGMPSLVLIGLGLVLIGNGIHLLIAAARKNTVELEVIWFSLGDFSWWLATLALITAQQWITTTAGIVIAALIALCVASLGVAQLWLLGMNRLGNSTGAHLKAFMTSWSALPTWVKVWLIVLNVVFLASIAYLPDRFAVVTLIAYVSTAPLLAGQVGYDGGLRRILAVAHLVPWLPLLAWLILTPNTTSFETILIGTLAICLAFDINDVRLFFKGDRAIVGADHI